LNIVVLPATGISKEPDPVFYLVGSPGQAATESAGRAAAEEEQINASRDVVLVDQRGTGGSNPLRCRFYPDGDLRQYLGPPPSPEQVRKCRVELGAFCGSWVRARLPKGYADPVHAFTPTLLISGALDAVTPKRFADEVAAGLPNSSNVIVPYGGHINAGTCLDAIAAQFIAQGSAERLDLSCVEEIRRPPFSVQEDRPGS